VRIKIKKTTWAPGEAAPVVKAIWRVGLAGIEGGLKRAVDMWQAGEIECPDVTALFLLGKLTEMGIETEMLA